MALTWAKCLDSFRLRYCWPDTKSSRGFLSVVNITYGCCTYFWKPEGEREAKMLMLEYEREHRKPSYEYVHE